jgi:hypothetical protein
MRAFLQRPKYEAVPMCMFIPSGSVGISTAGVSMVCFLVNISMSWQTYERIYELADM